MSVPMQTQHSDIIVTSVAEAHRVDERVVGTPRSGGTWAPFRVLLMLTTLLTLYVIKPFWSALFLAGALAVASYPLFVRLTRLLRGRAQLAGLLMTGALFIFLIAPLASIVTIGITEVTAGLEWVQDVLGIDSLRDLSAPQLPPGVDDAVGQTTQFLHISRSDLRSYASQALNWVQAAAPSILSTSVNAAGVSVFVLAGYFFFLVDGRRLGQWVYRLSPLPHTQTEELFDEFRNVSSAALLGTVATSALVGVLVAVGFMVASIPHAVFFGLFTILAGFIPVIGSALVWLPAVGILFLNGRVGMGLGLLVWCGVGVFIADNVVKPLLMRGKGEMHFGLLILSLFGGLAMLGGIGIIAGPVIVAFMMAMLRIYLRDYSTPSAAPSTQVM